ncbi:BnaA07g28660D [Brassica napus]|uniref:BnaA07g28660D protein n=2 Tax=Brassica napus TaxID=3708 RepID=A0A078HN46_BRANA|nr:BnaA07g28660D [Brassica napus]
MMTFLDSVEEEVKTAREEERKVMELVKRTTEYYQAGASRRKVTSSSESTSTQRNAVKFPVLPPNFMSDRSRSDSGESDSDM